LRRRAVSGQYYSIEGSAPKPVTAGGTSGIACCITGIADFAAGSVGRPAPSAGTFNRFCRALTEAVLQGIRTDVFNVSAPIAP